MKKLLYITANTKPEELSSSRTAARQLVRRLCDEWPELSVTELDLYTAPLPIIKYNYFEGRNSLVNAETIKDLTLEEQADVAQINKLCDQFVDHDIYVLASPMWSLSYPAVVKQYLDCIIMAGKTIAFKNDKPYGLLNDRKRLFIYVQSSGMSLPFFLRPMLNKGLGYVEDITKFMGISDFKELLVDGTGTTEAERLDAIAEAGKRTEDLIRTLTQ